VRDLHRRGKSGIHSELRRILRVPLLEIILGLREREAESGNWASGWPRNRSSAWYSDQIVAVPCGTNGWDDRWPGRQLKYRPGGRQIKYRPPLVWPGYRGDSSPARARGSPHRRRRRRHVNAILARGCSPLHLDHRLGGAAPPSSSDRTLPTSRVARARRAAGTTAPSSRPPSFPAQTALY